MPLSARTPGFERIFEAVLAKPLLPQKARVTLAARLACRRGIVATAGQAIVDAQFDPLLNDFGLGHCNERSMDFERLPALDAVLGGQIRHRLKRLNELRPAIRVAGIIERIYANENVA